MRRPPTEFEQFQTTSGRKSFASSICGSARTGTNTCCRPGRPLVCQRPPPSKLPPCNYALAGARPPLGHSKSQRRPSDAGHNWDEIRLMIFNSPPPNSFGLVDLRPRDQPPPPPPPFGGTSPQRKPFLMSSFGPEYAALEVVNRHDAPAPRTRRRAPCPEHRFDLNGIRFFL